MGHEDDRTRVFRQMPLQPGHALGVKVVGGLVEQEDVGTLEQHSAERHPPALAAGEGADVGLAWGQPHGVHGNLDPAVEVPAPSGLDGILHVGLFLEQLVHLVGIRPLAQPRVDLIKPVEVVPHCGHGLFDVAANVPAWVERRLLGHIADRGPRRRSRCADEVLVEPCHNPQERAFARSVPPDDADLAPG